MQHGIRNSNSSLYMKSPMKPTKNVAPATPLYTDRPSDCTSDCTKNAAKKPVLYLACKAITNGGVSGVASSTTRQACGQQHDMMYTRVKSQLCSLPAVSIACSTGICLLCWALPWVVHRPSGSCWDPALLPRILQFALQLQCR